METSPKLESLAPRHLHYRNQYKLYFMVLMVLGGLILSWLGFYLSRRSWGEFLGEFTWELWLSFFYFSFFGGYYFFALRWRMNCSVQVYPDRIEIHRHGKTEDLHFTQISSVKKILGSIFSIKTHSGQTEHFSSSLERIDYVWEGIYAAREDLMSPEEFEKFRLILVQSDHHQKRQEWFLKHKFIDLLNWLVLPGIFLFVSYSIQTREIIVHQSGMYFFRLAMYSLLVLTLTTIFYSFLFKKLVFDKRVASLIKRPSTSKLRDLELEGVVIHRSKLMQMLTISFVFALVMRLEINMFSLSKIKGDVSSFDLRQGETIVIDNRYNCVACKFSLKDGDVVLFGKGTLGQFIANSGEMVGQMSQDPTGRVIASTNIQEVPSGHVAIKLSNQKEILMVRVQDLIGKVQK